MKMYFKGGKGIKDPVDFNGDKIKEGDTLTFDNFDPFFSDEYYSKNYPKWTKEEVERRRHEPTYKVKYNEKGFFYGKGIEKPTSEFSGRLYLHDFRFKHTKIIKKNESI